MYPSAGHYPMTAAASFCAHAAPRCPSVHPASARCLKAPLCYRTFQLAARPTVSLVDPQCNTSEFDLSWRLTHGAGHALDFTEPWLEVTPATLSLTQE